MEPKVTIKDYYDLNPPVGNNAGDIWSDLPTHGLLGEHPLPGIVITPACDLTNRKAETVTYLPVIPVRSYFSTIAFLPELQRATEGQLQFAGFDSLLEWPGGLFPPDSASLERAEAELQKAIEEKARSEKHKRAIRRALAGLRLLTNVTSPELIEANLEDLAELFGEGEWGSLRQRLIRNALRSDLHFLPADEQPEAWSGVAKHSVVLFRYPVTGPIELFDCAQDVAIADWESCVSKIAAVCPFAADFVTRPIKRTSLRPRFLGDLLTRYVGMYIRLGSPDFSAETVARYSNDLGSRA